MNNWGRKKEENGYILCKKIAQMKININKTYVKEIKQMRRRKFYKMTV